MSLLGDDGSAERTATRVAARAARAADEDRDRPTPADRAAVLSIDDFPGGETWPDREPRLNKLCWEDGTIELEASCDDLERDFMLDVSVERHVTPAAAGSAYAHRLGFYAEPERWSERADLVSWGDASTCFVERTDGRPDGLVFVGRRGARLICASWSGALYDAVDAEAADGFLRGRLLERMAEHELVCDG